MPGGQGWCAAFRQDKKAIARSIPEDILWQELQLKADLFDYLCWLEQAGKPVEIKDEHLCLAGDGTTCWGKTYAEAVRVAMEYDKGIQDAGDVTVLHGRRTGREG
jgi:hypothetical protein